MKLNQLFNYHMTMVEEFMVESFNPLNILNITPKFMLAQNEQDSTYILLLTLCNATNPIIGAKTIIIVQNSISSELNIFVKIFEAFLLY